MSLKSLNKNPQRCYLYETLYVPKLSFNLLSVYKGTGRRKNVFTDYGCQILDEKRKIIVTATKFRNLYYLNLDENQVLNNDT